MQLSTPVRDVLYSIWHQAVGAVGAHGRDIVVWPPVESQEQMEDLLPRLQFHFAGLHFDERILVPVTDPKLRQVGSRPYYLGDYSDRFAGRVSYPLVHRDVPLWVLSANYRGVLLSQPASSIQGGSKLKYLPNVAPIHPDDVEMPTFWIAKLMHRSASSFTQRCGEILRKHIATLPKKERVYLLLTGPSLSRFREFDFSDGYVIGCNSVVSNEELMAHARPQFISACDPIFHFGPSIYAESFRRDLTDAATRYPFLFLTLTDYHHLMGSHTGVEPDRVCFVPKSTQFKYVSLNDRWAVSQTSNIMTMFMLPLALSLAKEIYVIGADGREPGETYFWKHDPASQLTDKMQAIKDCHPAFFAKRNYADYYDEHCEHVRHWVSSIESQGKNVYTLTPSHIPALRDRLVEGGG